MKSKKFWIILFAGTLAAFLIYFFFISDSNFRKHRQLNKKIDNLEKSISETKNKIENNYSYEQLSQDSGKLEKYGRENLNMQREGEDVFVIVYE